MGWGKHTDNEPGGKYLILRINLGRRGECIVNIYANENKGTKRDGQNNQGGGKSRTCTKNQT